MKLFDHSVYTALCEAIECGCTVKTGSGSEIDYVDKDGVWFYRAEDNYPQMAPVNYKTIIMQNLQDNEEWEIL